MQPDSRPDDDAAAGDEPAAMEPAPTPPSTYIRRNWKTIYPGAFITGGALGFTLPRAWTWFLDQDLDPAQGTVIGGIFVGIVGTIAYTGTHLSRKSIERIAADKNALDTTNADRAHDLTVTQELRARFVTIAAQFADPSPEIRLAGVYALEALTDDWLDRGAPHEAQTCINYYCGYLTRPYTPPTEHPHLRQTVVTPDAATTIQRTYTHPHDDLHVRQIITRTIAAHTQPGHHHNWSGFDYALDRAYLHDANFTGCHFTQNISFYFAQFHGERTSFDGAEFHSEWTSFDGAEFHGKWTSFDKAQFRGAVTSFTSAQFHGKWTSFDGAEFRAAVTSFTSAQFHGKSTSFDKAQFRGALTSFTIAQFHSKESTLFRRAEFHSKLTSFEGAEFHSSKWTSFDRAEFHSERTSFMNPRAWKNVYFEWDPQIPYAVIAPKPVTVLPAEWPPTVIDPA